MNTHLNGSRDRMIGRKFVLSMLKLVPAKLRHEFASKLVLGGEFLQAKRGGSGWNTVSEHLAALRVLSGSSPTIFDVGANQGDWAAGILANMPQAQLYLFEPDARLVGSLEARFRSHRERIRVCPIALGAAEDDKEMFLYQDSHLSPPRPRCRLCYAAPGSCAVAR